MQPFIANARDNLKKKCPQKLFIIGPNFFFSIFNWPENSPNVIYCSLKMAPFATSKYNDFACSFFRIFVRCI